MHEHDIINICDEDVCGICYEERLMDESARTFRPDRTTFPKGHKFGPLKSARNSVISATKRGEIMSAAIAEIRAKEKR